MKKDEYSVNNCGDCRHHIQECGGPNCHHPESKGGIATSYEEIPENCPLPDCKESSITEKNVEVKS